MYGSRFASSWSVPKRWEVEHKRYSFFVSRYNVQRTREKEQQGFGIMTGKR